MSCRRTYYYFVEALRGYTEDDLGLSVVLDIAPARDCLEHAEDGDTDALITGNEWTRFKRPPPELVHVSISGADNLENLRLHAAALAAASGEPFDDIDLAEICRGVRALIALGILPRRLSHGEKQAA